MIYLCRHGQTVFNQARRFQGQVDSPLTALGRAQAQAMGRTLAGLLAGQPFKVWASPLGRTQETLALILAEAGAAPVVSDARLMEVSMGAWDGLDQTEIEAEYPGARDGLAPGSWFFYGPGGERFEEFGARLAAVMAEIAADPVPVKVVVSHGVAIRVIRGQHQGLDRAAMLALHTAQDGIYALAPAGAVRFISC